MRPSCGPCCKKGLECPGYSRPVKWCQQYNPATLKDARTREHCQSRSQSLETGNGSQDLQLTPPLYEKGSAYVDRMTIPQLWDYALDGSLYGNEIESFLEVDQNLSTPDFDLELTSRDEPDKSTEFLGHTQTDDLQAGDLLDINADTFNLILSRAESSQFTPPLFKIMPSDQTMVLSDHYFSLICSINSCFDSPYNPFRSYVAGLMLSCPLVFHCVMTMSAAHICRRKKEMADAVLEHRNEAISCLTLEEPGKGSRDIKVETILGSILLGMTSAWHDPSSLGLTHLHSGRALFKQWIGCLQSTRPLGKLLSTDRNASFLVGIMAYWEALTSFLIDEGPNAFDYLTPFCDQEAESFIYPNPWTGVSTSLFIYAARAGALSRQNRLARNLSSYITSTIVHDEIHSRQLQEATELKRKVLNYQLPDKSLIEDTGDKQTSLDDLQTLAKIYRFVVLLQLYITFPDLLNNDDAPSPELLVPGNNPKISPGEKSNTSCEMAVTALAATILNLIASVSENSGIRVLLTLPLIVAGSALQNCSKKDSQQYNASGLPTIEQEMLSLHSSRPMISYWRSFVRQRLNALYEHVGLEPIMRAKHILEVVWAKSDLMRSSIEDEVDEASSANSFRTIHWIDTMIEERLESIFG